MPTMSQLDPGQIIKSVYDAANQAIQVNVVAGGGGGPSSTNVMQFGGSDVVTGTGISGAGIPRVTVSSDSSITNISGTVSLPTGASTSANQSTANASLASIDSKLTSPLSVNSSTVSYTLSQFVRNDYSSTNVTTSAYVQLIASTSNSYKEIHIADTSGQTLKLATGAPGVEVDIIVIPPGGTFPIKFAVPSGTRLSIKALSATASSGEIDLQLLG